MVLISGPEALLAERAVADVVTAVRAAHPDVEVSESDAVNLDAQRLAEMTGASLFTTQRVAVINDLAALPGELAEQVAGLAEAADPDLALVLVHRGGVKPKALLERLNRAKVVTIPAASVKAWELPRFVAAEVRRHGGSIEAAAAPALVDAVGHDLRALSAAVAQLVADAEDDRITERQIRRYFAGRAEVTSFAVADAALARRAGMALEQLRWALSTGVAPVLITSALAGGLRGLGRYLTAPSGLREADLAREAGVPPWKVKVLRTQARNWDEASVAAALRTVATADAAVKGAAGDADFALEQAVLAVCTAGRS